MEQLNNVVIIGLPGTGKTTLANTYKSDNVLVIHGDIYKKHNYDVEYLERDIRVIKKLYPNKALVLEGCIGVDYLLYSKATLNPNKVILLQRSPEDLTEVYKSHNSILTMKSPFIKQLSYKIDQIKKIYNIKVEERYG